MKTNIQEIAARQLAEDCGFPDRWKKLLGTAACQWRALRIALDRLIVAFWDETPLGYIAQRFFGCQLRQEIRKGADTERFPL